MIELNKNTPKQMAMIYNHLMERATSDASFNEKLCALDKTLEDLYSYVLFKAKQMAVNGCACVEDKEVYGWAIHYVDENGEPEDFKKPTKTQFIPKKSEVKPIETKDDEELEEELEEPEVIEPKPKKTKKPKLDIHKNDIPLFEL